MQNEDTEGSSAHLYNAAAAAAAQSTTDNNVIFRKEVTLISARRIQTESPAIFLVDLLRISSVRHESCSPSSPCAAAAAGKILQHTPNTAHRHGEHV